MRTNLKKRKKKLYTFLFSASDPGKSSSKSGSNQPRARKTQDPCWSSADSLNPWHSLY